MSGEEKTHPGRPLDAILHAAEVAALANSLLGLSGWIVEQQHLVCGIEAIRTVARIGRSKRQDLTNEALVQKLDRFDLAASRLFEAFLAYQRDVDEIEGRVPSTEVHSINEILDLFKEGKHA